MKQILFSAMPLATKGLLLPMAGPTEGNLWNLKASFS